jgi:hypothetical protein
MPPQMSQPPNTSTEPTMTVRPIDGEPTRFWVQSRTKEGKWYLVDVAAKNGCGQCQCIRWDTISWPRIRDTQNLPPRLRCAHLKAAREYALNVTIRTHIREHPSE